MSPPLFGRNPRSPCATPEKHPWQGHNADPSETVPSGVNFFERGQPVSRQTRYHRRNAGTGHATGGERIERAFVDWRSWAACRSRQPARPIQPDARNLLPSSRSEAGSSGRIHSEPWPEIRRLLSGTHPSWTFATPLKTQMAND